MTGPYLAVFAMFFVAPLVYSVVLSLRSPPYERIYRAAQLPHRLLQRGVLERGGPHGLLRRHTGERHDRPGDNPGPVPRQPLLPGKKVLRALLYFLPYAVPGVIAAIKWGFLLEPDLDSALNVPHQLGITNAAVTPLDYRLSLYAIMLIVTWEWTGYNMTILMTSLTNVPHQVLEAAKIDGCSELSIATRIKLPLIRRTIVFIVMLSIIGTFQLFNEPVILNEIASMGNSITPNQIIYNTAFSFGNEQLAAAQSVVLAAITIVATVVFYSIVRRRMDPFGATRGGDEVSAITAPARPGRAWPGRAACWPGG